MTLAPAPLTIARLLADAASDNADRVAITAERPFTFRGLDAEVREHAAALVALGVAPGDRVAIWASNTADTVLAMLAAVVASAVPVPLNTRFTVTEAQEVVGHAGCRVMVAPGEFLGRGYAAEALAMAGRLGHPLAVLSTGPAAVPPGALAFRSPDAGAADRDALAARLREQGPDDLAMIQYTSGTTGRPRGACLRQGPILQTARRWAQVAGLGPDDVYPVTYPLAHVGGFKTGILTPLLARARSVLLPVTDTRSLTEAITRQGATVINGPPPVLRSLIAAVRDGSMPRPSGLRLAVCGAAVVAPQLVRETLDELAVTDVIVAYGLSEASGVCTMTRPGDPVDLVSKTLGRPIEGVQVRIAGSDDRTGVGEIQIRGANVMTGYVDDPAATEAAFDNGWLRTGDLGRIGPDGYLRIAGRVKDMVVVGGFNVYPAEVEHVLLDCPGVADVAVVGIPDERLGEVAAAFVVPAGGASNLSESELRDWARQRLANYKVPRRIWTVPELPRGSVEKVARAELARRAVELLAAPDA